MAKRTTARDVARQAGVSRSTVSFVLNNVAGMRISEETRRRVLQAASQMDYHPDAIARLMVTGQSKVLGFVVRQSPVQAFADQFMPEVMRGLSHAAAIRGYYVLFAPLPPDPKAGTFMALLRERRVDGFVLSGPRDDDGELRQLQAMGVPVVLMGRLPDSELPFVDVDNVAAARVATEHLLQFGRRRIGLITQAPLVYTSSADRLAGYRQALAVAGIGYDDELVRYGDLTPLSGRVAMDSLLSLGPSPEAVFVASDMVALGALQAIRQHGLCVPRDIALVGFDDVPLAQFMDPPLSSIRLPAYELGWQAGELLMGLLAKEPIGQPSLLLPTQLVVRASSGANCNGK